jgi:hypothetical protein
VPSTVTVLATAVLVVASGVATVERRYRRRALRGALWPWMVDEVEARVRGGQAPAAAVLGVALHGPPRLRAAAGAAQRVWSSRGDTVAALDELRRRAADPRVDRLCELVGAVHVLDGDGAALLARLRAAAQRDVRRDRELERHAAAVRSAAWLALVPVAASVSGHLPAAVAALAIGAALCAWLGVIVARPRGARVHLDRGLHS